MLCIEIRGGVAVAAYSDETPEVIIVDYDDNQANHIIVGPASSIPDEALSLINKMPLKGL